VCKGFRRKIGFDICEGREFLSFHRLGSISFILKNPKIWLRVVMLKPGATASSFWNRGSKITKLKIGDKNAIGLDDRGRNTIAPI
jgi:hypothetical protein